jgi:hypothetical protein
LIVSVYDGVYPTPTKEALCNKDAIAAMTGEPNVGGCWVAERVRNVQVLYIPIGHGRQARRVREAVAALRR